MRRFLIYTFLLSLISCAMGPANSTKQTHISVTGGNYQQKSWDDSLVFKRTSWFMGATMAYDILITKLDKNSPFSYWLESDQDKFANECSEVYIALIYSYIGSINLDIQSTARITKQISDIGFEEIAAASFRNNIGAHNVFNMWHLGHHKIAGFCYKKLSGAPQEIPVAMPGFKTINILSK